MLTWNKRNQGTTQPSNLDGWSARLRLAPQAPETLSPSFRCCPQLDSRGHLRAVLRVLERAALVRRKLGVRVTERHRARHGLRKRVMAFRGAQYSIVTTLVSAKQSVTKARVALAVAKKERTYLRSRAIEGEPAWLSWQRGRWSAETAEFSSPWPKRETTSPRQSHGSMAATVESHAGLWCGRALGCGDNIPSVADVVWDDRLEWASPGGWHEGVFFFFLRD